MIGFLVRGLMTALGLWIASALLGGVHSTGFLSILGAGLLLGVVNAIVRPVIVFLTLPITIFTLGLFLLVVNAAMLGLVALMLPGFRITGFWTAVGASLIVSVVSWIGSWFIGPKGRVEIIRTKRD